MLLSDHYEEDSIEDTRGALYFQCTESCFSLDSWSPVGILRISASTTSVRSTEGTSQFVAASSGVFSGEYYGGCGQRKQENKTVVSRR